MPGPIGYIFWSLTLLIEASVLVCAFKRSSVRRYFAINAYVAASICSGIGRYITLTRHGLLSSEYIYFYYYSDAVLTILLYFALLGLFATVFEELKAEWYLRVGSTLLLAGTALFSYLVVQQTEHHRMITRYVVEMSQNLYFVGVVLTYILWGAVLKLRETRIRVIQFVLSLGVYFSVFAANYALRNLYPDVRMVWEYTPPVMACLLPLAWAHAFWRVPEEARLAPSRLATVPR